MSGLTVSEILRHRERMRDDEEYRARYQVYNKKKKKRVDRN
jgi:Zn-finger nucleic acid-binding protein